VREVKKSTIFANGRRFVLARKLRPDACASYSHSDATSHRPYHLQVTCGRRDLDNFRISRQGRSIMADQPNNQGERMDERSGTSGVGGGSGGGTSGNRNESGGDSRNTSTVSRKTPRGFAAMDPQAQRAIAAKGGRAAHQKGTAHEFTSEEARVAGRKGGEASRGGRRSSTSSGSNS
jgi:general stress protein YciG